MLQLKRQQRPISCFHVLGVSSPNCCRWQGVKVEGVHNFHTKLPHGRQVARPALLLSPSGSSPPPGSVLLCSTAWARCWVYASEKQSYVAWWLAGVFSAILACLYCSLEGRSVGDMVSAGLCMPPSALHCMVVGRARCVCGLVLPWGKGFVSIFPQLYPLSWWKTCSLSIFLLLSCVAWI